MELLPSLLADIAGFCALPSAEPAAVDRRKHVRFPVAARATISSLSRGLDAIEQVIILRDMSISGLGLLCPEPMESGEEFVIQFSGEHGLPARILCKAQRCEPGGMGGAQFIVGATFELVIHPAQPEDADRGSDSPAELAFAWAKECLFEQKVDGTIPSETGGASDDRNVGFLTTIRLTLQSLLQRSGRRWLSINQDFADETTRTA